MTTPADIKLPTRRLAPALVELLRGLKVGQRVRVTQTVRVGARTWESVTEGAFREINYLATGLATSRVPEDDLIVPMLHFTKDGGELSSIAIDEKSKVEVVG